MITDLMAPSFQVCSIINQVGVGKGAVGVCQNTHSHFSNTMSLAEIKRCLPIPFLLCLLCPSELFFEKQTHVLLVPLYFLHCDYICLLIFLTVPFVQRKSNLSIPKSIIIYIQVIVFMVLPFMRFSGWDLAKWCSFCPACVRYWIQSPA